MFPLATLLAPLFSVAAAPLDNHQAQEAEDKFKRRITPIVTVAENASPAVVYIQTDGFTYTPDFFGRIIPQRFNGAGSGVVILKEGFIITNNHVVEGAKKIKVSFDKSLDDQEYDAEVVSSVKEEDLALLRIKGERAFPTIPLGTSSDLMPGETVIAIGNPYGQTYTVSQGIISGLHRNVDIPASGLHFGDLIQTDAPINLGNSGGPLLNINGELIGINSAVNTQAQSIGFAITVDRVKAVLEEQLMPTWLGFDVEPGEALKVGKVVPAGPAAVAGLKPGDCIVSLNGQAVFRPEDFRLARVGLSGQHRVQVAIERNGSTVPLAMDVWDKTDGLLFEHLGLKAEQLTIGRATIVRVREVYPGGPAARLGLQPGDMIDAVKPILSHQTSSWKLSSPRALASLVSNPNLPPGTELELDVYRDENKDGRYTRDELLRGTLTIQ